MTGAQKIVLLALGFLAAFLILAQLALGQLIYQREDRPASQPTNTPVT